MSANSQKPVDEGAGFSSESNASPQKENSTFNQCVDRTMSEVEDDRSVLIGGNSASLDDANIGQKTKNFANELSPGTSCEPMDVSLQRQRDDKADTRKPASVTESPEDEEDAVPSNAICVQDSSQETQLMVAVRGDNCEEIQRLVMSGYDCHALCKTDDEAKPTKVQVRRDGFRKDVQMLGYAALHVAVIHSSIKTISCLLSLGVDVNQRDKHERTPLQLAVCVNRPKVAQLLLTAGADVNTRSASGRCPLMEAVLIHSVHLTDMLLAAGADPDLTDIKGTTALAAAVFNTVKQPEAQDYMVIIHSLIQAGCDINKRNNGGATALMSAAGMHVPQAVELLINKGADINAKDNAGRTAFMMASENSQRHTATVKLLMKHGAATHIADKKGSTPLGKALKFGFVRLLRLLLSADAVPHSHDILEAPRIVQIREILPDFNAWLLSEFYQPRSLRRLARETVRNCLSPNNLIRVQDLGLPSTLNAYVLGETDSA